MKIAFAASEGVPYCKTGGLADVVGALSEALAAKRHSVRVFLPLYRDVHDRFPDLKALPGTIEVPLGHERETVRLFEAAPRANLKATFIGSDRYFDRQGFYGPRPGTDFGDNDRRFTFFCRGVLEACKALRFKPDVVHGHDWQAGLLPAMIQTEGAFFADTASVFSIHNMAYQGHFPASSFALTGLPASLFSIGGAEFYGRLNFLKAALTQADMLNTVSPTYAKEIRTPQFGCGLEGVLEQRATDFEGILNGLDTTLWDPRADRLLAAPFSARDLDRRAACKRDLQRAAGLSEDPSLPILSFIGRLDPQKGIDLLLEVAPQFMKLGVQFISLGQGHPEYTHQLLALKQRYPAQVSVQSAFAEPLAHKIYAGTDLFAMPSRYEPCGLGQLIAMRYGAIPVVTPTGGLLDTVRPQTAKREGTGFVAEHKTPGAILSAVMDGLALHKNARAWRALQLRAMSQDFSWRKSVADYLLLYEAAIERRRGGR